MEPSGSEASEAQTKDKGNVPVIDVDSENVNQSVNERVSDHVDEQKKRRYKSFVWDHFLASKVLQKLNVLIVVWLELTEHDYTSYFFNEPEDGEEGTRMMPKTKKKKKNVVGVPNEDDWSNASRTETFNQGGQVSKRLKTLSAKTIEIYKIVEDALKKLYVHYKIKLEKHNDETFTVSSSSTPSEDDCSMKIDPGDGFLKVFGDPICLFCASFAEHILTLVDLEHKREAPAVENPELVGV
uniref:Zinc finger, BED-type n=1 Tax=Tanacetum cinerariifolium TaxID=118510 RepID=A0A699H5N3_TANCI|nr:zinc finger, BED-type [Tanacetum cinerariifolium]